MSTSPGTLEVDSTTPSDAQVGPTVAHVQADLFCAGCGYNLHTRPVQRDERLGLLVCQCPECGRFTAAGQSTTAARTWLNRLATLLLTAWVGFALLIFALCTLFLGMLAYGHLAEQIELRPITAASTRPFNPARLNRYSYYPYRYQPRTIPALDTDDQTRHLWAQIWITFFAVVLGVITGGLFASLVWHCRGPRQLLAFLPPVLGCGVAAVLWASNPWGELIRDWGLMQIGVFFVYETVAVGVGLLIGRPFTRGLVRLLVPPKPRQHLAFLWIVDGKTLRAE